MVDHLVFFAVREGASQGEIKDLVSSIRALRDDVPSTVDLSVGEDFSGRSGGYTHAIFARFEDATGLASTWSIPHIWPSSRSSTPPQRAASSPTTSSSDVETSGYENITPRALKSRLDAENAPCCSMCASPGSSSSPA